MTQWTRFQDRQDQLVHKDLGYSENVVIATPSETYNGPGEGYTLTYSDQGTFSIALMTPSESAEKDQFGTETDVDLIAEVPVSVVENLSDGLDGYGEDNEGSARLKPVDSNNVYDVATVEDPRNGIIVAGLVEV